MTQIYFSHMCRHGSSHELPFLLRNCSTASFFDMMQWPRSEHTHTNKVIAATQIYALLTNGHASSYFSQPLQVLSLWRYSTAEMHMCVKPLKKKIKKPDKDKQTLSWISFTFLCPCTNVPHTICSLIILCIVSILLSLGGQYCSLRWLTVAIPIQQATAIHWENRTTPHHWCHDLDLEPPDYNHARHTIRL